MKSILKAMTVFCFFAATAIVAGPGEQTSRLRVGVLELENIGERAEAAVTATDRLRQCIAAQGMVEIFTQERIKQELEGLGSKMPGHCRDPRCVMNIGGMLNLDRMVYGSVDMNDKRCGMRLYMLDIRMRRQIGEASIETEAPALLDSVVATAVSVLYGKQTAENRPIRKYFGPEVHHEKQLIYSMAGFIGAGLAWGLVNYRQLKDNVSLLSFEDREEALSGKPSSADQIPMFARPAALADAYVAASDDAYGVLYNPAGMAWVRNSEAIVGYQYRFGFDNIAASYVNKATREIGFGQALLYSGDRDGLLTELYFVSAIAYKFNQVPSFLRPISLGMNIKFSSQTVGAGSVASGGAFDEFSVSGGAFGAALDFGLIAELSDQIRYGCVFRDVPIITAWHNSSTGERYYEGQATTLHMGGTYQADYTTFLIAEGQIPIFEDQSWKMAGGIEQEFFRVVLARIGLQKEIQSLYETPWKVTGGFGFDVDTEPVFGKSLCLDGSYEYNTLRVFDVINISFKIGF